MTNQRELRELGKEKEAWLNFEQLNCKEDELPSIEHQSTLKKIGNGDSRSNYTRFWLVKPLFILLTKKIFLKKLSKRIFSKNNP